MLGLVTAAAAVLVSAVRRERTAWCLAAGALLGAASWVKVNAFFALPGIVLVAWATAPRRDWRRLGVPLALFVAAAAVVQMPWEIWQWSVLGTPFPSLPGRSSAGLVAGNRFVYYLTVVRSPWIYPQLIPRVLWTLVPALLLWAVWWHDRSVRLTGAALVAWMVAVTVPTMVLGALGYAKLVRYAILITPAVSLLWVVVVARAWEDVRAGRPLPLRPALVNLLLGLALLGCALELVQGVKTGVIDRYALIVPLF
jgi:4-amino-4-deoxy-L-arabinose transferase-like glycosyltransferase